MMPFIPASTPDFLALSYRPDLHLLVSRWQRPVSDAELQAGYRATLALAQAVGCPYWQLDLRGGNAPEPATRQWLTEKFLPGLASQLAAPACLGYLLSPQLLRQLAPIATAPGSATPGSSAALLRVAFFAEEGSLTAWLAQCQHHGAADLAPAGFIPSATPTLAA